MDLNLRNSYYKKPNLQLKQSTTIINKSITSDYFKVINLGFNWNLTQILRILSSGIKKSIKMLVNSPFKKGRGGDGVSKLLKLATHNIDINPRV